ncbi:NAD(P)-binding protein [Athelia psychrophila]|uniref:NAD(P)-binding protein n=1 Tax=Athelia psychrophila TaxID=1759441 RepID=A0A166WFF6_9AGAM|nr:NAD(P)-binding protein [Fibularhizoctonia sp. CBS 109695]
MRTIITGASGLLGTQVYKAFIEQYGSKDVLGLAFSRAAEGGHTKKLDLMDAEATETVFTQFKPDWVIHCAAERRPDVAEKDPEGTQKLNVDLPRRLSQLAKAENLNFTLVYISTDYVFDGKLAPYAPSSPPNPVQLYGQTKLGGENAVLRPDGPNADVNAKAIVLRVPVLYGPAPHNSDSAINILLDVVQDQSGKAYKMDHYATRYPTNVIDIANFLARLSALTTIPKILHYSAAEAFTKYEMCQIFGKILGVPIGHIKADSTAPSTDATPRPKDCRLDTQETEALWPGGEGLKWVPFEQWWSAHLK